MPVFAVCVKKSKRTQICADGCIWVRDHDHDFYVRKKDRGLWACRSDAKKALREAFEEVVCLSVDDI
jgi:hypothetical protein